VEVQAVSVAPLRSSTRPAGTAFAGRFKVERAKIAGEETDPRYPDLTLEADGTYRMGSSRGLWNLTGGKVLLSGHFSEWGTAEVGPQSNTLTFRFQRGELAFELVFLRVSESASAVSPSTETGSRGPVDRV
jgi:hypothetical protein